MKIFSIFSRLFLLALSLGVVSFVSAQNANYSDDAPYKKDSLLPNFSLLLTDSATLSKNDLPSGRATLIIYFSPDCGHCQSMAEKYAGRMDKLKDVNLVWATYWFPLDTIARFAEEYRLKGFKNVYFGKDLKFFLPSFYRVEYTPFMALYDTKQHLVATWPQGVAPDELLIKLYGKL